MMIKNYNFEAMKEPERRKIAVEAFRLELCDLQYHLRRAGHSAFGGHYMDWMLMDDYNLKKVSVEHGEAPLHDMYENINNMQEKVMQVLLCTAQYDKK